MDNPYDGYIATNQFEVKGYYNDEPPIIINQGEHLLFSRKGEDDWEFVHNGKYVYITEELVKNNLKIHSDLYQEQFAHLDKNHLYFGQLDCGNEFVIEEHGQKVSLMGYFNQNAHTTKTYPNNSDSYLSLS